MNQALFFNQKKRRQVQLGFLVLCRTTKLVFWFLVFGFWFSVFGFGKTSCHPKTMRKTFVKTSCHGKPKTKNLLHTKMARPTFGRASVVSFCESNKSAKNDVLVHETSKNDAKVT
jgi:hypothetical protein